MTIFGLHIDRGDLPALEAAVEDWECAGARIEHVSELDREKFTSDLSVQISCDDGATAFYMGRKYEAFKRSGGEA